MIELIPLRPQSQAWLWGSVLSPYSERYCEHLIKAGYSARTIHRYLRCIAHFAHWLTTQHVTVSNVDDRTVSRFVDGHLPRCVCPNPIPRKRADVSAALGHLLFILGMNTIPRFLWATPDALRQEVNRFTKYLDLYLRIMTSPTLKPKNLIPNT